MPAHTLGVPQLPPQVLTQVWGIRTLPSTLMIQLSTHFLCPTWGSHHPQHTHDSVYQEGMIQSSWGEPIPKTSKCLHQSVGQKDQDSYAENQKTILDPGHGKRGLTMYTEHGKCSKNMCQIAKGNNVYRCSCKQANKYTEFRSEGSFFFQYKVTLPHSYSLLFLGTWPLPFADSWSPDLSISQYFINSGKKPKKQTKMPKPQTIVFYQTSRLKKRPSLLNLLSAGTIRSTFHFRELTICKCFKTLQLQYQWNDSFLFPQTGRNTTLEILMQNKQKEKAKSPPGFPKEMVLKIFYSELTCFCQCAAMAMQNITLYSLTLNQTRQ